MIGQIISICSGFIIFDLMLNGYLHYISLPEIEAKLPKGGQLIHCSFKFEVTSHPHPVKLFTCRLTYRSIIKFLDKFV